MLKKLVLALCITLIGLSIYSCSELILPKQVKVKGTVDVPARIGSASLSSVLAEKLHNTFAADTQTDTKIYTVDYKKQTVQTFCIHIPIEMTEDLNPNNFLKIIDKRLNDGIHAEPRSIYAPIPYGSPIGMINLLGDDNKIDHVSLKEIASYVVTINFDEYKEGVNSGIGLNFHFDTIPDGLKMKVECREIDILTGKSIMTIFSDSKPIKKGDNIFGNDKPLRLEVNEYQDDRRVLYFTIELQPAEDYLDSWDHGYWKPAGFSAGQIIEIKGEMRLFRAWTEAQIDLAKALKASATDDNIFGRFPAKAFDLSELNKFFGGGFEFNGLEVKIYMDGPDPKSINNLGAMLDFNAQYRNDKENKELYEELYYDDLFINSEPIKLDDYLNKDGFYKSKDLPGNTSGYEDKIKEKTIANIFKAMPNNLFFIYRIKVADNKLLTIYPDAFNDLGDSGAIKTTMMIMLPMSLIATGDDENRSTIFLSDILGKTDLLGRKNAEDLLNTEDIDYMRMTIVLFNQIFSKGHLFINEDNDLFPFPEGIKLNGKKTVAYVGHKEFEKMQKYPIIPDIRIEIDNGETISIPKKMGIVDIKFEMKGLIKLGEL
jgi:hypothetical protein